MIARTASGRVGVWHDWTESTHARTRDHYRGGPSDPGRVMLHTRCGRAQARRGSLLPGAAVTCRVCARMIRDLEASRAATYSEQGP